MTAILTPALAGAPRINLMPRSETARRERDRLIRLWVWVVLGAIVAALLIIAGALWLKLSADQRLVAEQSRTNTLLTQIASLSEVSGALATQEELTAFRSDAMASDLAWAPVVAKLTSVLPGGSVLTGFDMTVGGAPAGDDPAVEKGLVGTMYVESPTPLDIVAIIRSLRDVEGIYYADGQSVTSSEAARYQYLLSVEFDQTIYSNEYATDAGGDN